MANTLGPIFAPLVDWWNEALTDSNYSKLTEFRGGLASHNAWHTKYLRHEREQYNNKFHFLEKRWSEEPDVCDLAWDNVLRLTVFSGLERVIAIRQAYSVLKQRFFLPVNSAGTLGEVLNSGLRQGYFKGALLNAFQFLGVQYNTVLWARGADLKTQIFASSIFETLFHPVDTVKNILYADTAGAYKGAVDVVGKIVQEGSVVQLFNGVAFRLLYNAAFLWHLRNFYEGNEWQWVSTPLWLFSYGFLSIKTKLQVSETALSFQNIKDIAANGAERGLYRGLIPFAAINYLFSYQLYGLYSQTAQDNEVESLRNSLANNFKSPIEEKMWA